MDTTDWPRPLGNIKRIAKTEAPLLEVRGVGIGFGGVRALFDVDLDVAAGEICGLVGPNGAGKTSLFNCICGYYRPTSGRISLSGREITGRPPHKLAGLGVGRTFQHPVLQVGKTVLDNVLVGGHITIPVGPVRYALRTAGVRRRERELVARAGELLDYLGIGHLATVLAAELSFGGQKRVELARALMLGPSLLLLDEPASGLNHAEVMDLGELIWRIRDDRGVGILLVSHHFGIIEAITDNVVVLVQGKKIAEGPAAKVQRHPVVVEAYLGAVA